MPQPHITDDQHFRYSEQADNEFDRWLANLTGAKRKVLDTNDARDAYIELRIVELADAAAERKADARMPA